MEHKCNKCGHDRLTFFISAGQKVCRKPGCGHTAPITTTASKPFDRVVQQLASGRIPANQDCPWQNQCGTFLNGDCARKEFQDEEYTCPFARVFETEGQGKAA